MPSSRVRFVVHWLNNIELGAGAIAMGRDLLNGPVQRVVPGTAVKVSSSLAGGL